MIRTELKKCPENRTGHTLNIYNNDNIVFQYKYLDGVTGYKMENLALAMHEMGFNNCKKRLLEILNNGL